MDYSLFSPIPLNLSESLLGGSLHLVGNNIRLHTVTKGFPELGGVNVALLSVEETGQSHKDLLPVDYNQVRLSFYHLFAGNWNISVADLGALSPGSSLEETRQRLADAVSELLQLRIIPLVLGGSNALTYGMYRAFDHIKKGISLINVDSRLDFSTERAVISDETYMGQIINKAPHNLFNYTNVGYQTYYNSQEELDLVEELFFSAYRIGDVVQDFKILELAFRNSDVGSLDVFGATKAVDLGLTSHGLPNGFSSKDICAVCRHAGLGDTLSAFGIFEIPESRLAHQLAAQMIWYFIEGVNYRQREVPEPQNSNYERYIVTSDTYDIHFYKSVVTNRWWIRFPEYTMNGETMCFPCLEKDYLEAAEGFLPDAWYKMYQKIQLL